METMTHLQLAEQAANDLQIPVKNIIAELGVLEVACDETYEKCGLIGRDIAQRMKVVKEKFAEPKTYAHNTWKAICAMEAELLNPLKTAKDSASRKMGAYSQEKERQARLEEERRLAKERRKAEEAALAQAEALEASGDKKGAQRALEDAADPVSAPPPKHENAAPKASGTASRSTWRHRVIDEAAVPREYLILDEQKIRRIVSAMKADTKIPGIEVYEDRTTSFRA